MIPDQSLSSVLLQSPFLPPDDRPANPLQDYELGGVALNDPSQGLRVQVWTAYVDEDDIRIKPENGEATVLLTAPGTTEVALTFDQNMRPAVGFTQDGVSKLRWFDTNQGQQVIDEFPNAGNIRLGMDDKRPTQEQANDIIMAYLRNNNLYFRAQRDRFTIEYLLRENIDPEFRLIRVGMTRMNRFAFELFKPPPEQPLASNDKLPRIIVPVDCQPYLDRATFTIERDPVIHVPKEKKRA